MPNSPFSPRRLLVTGGAGFIGSAFVRLALARPGVERVVTLDKLTYAGHRENLAGPLDDPRHAFVHGDILDAPLVARLLAENELDAVVHFAAESHVDRSIDSAEPFVETNVTGTLRLLEAARRHQAGRSSFRFVHVSTDEVYGSLGPDDPAFTEEHPHQPNSPYAASKAAADHLARAWFHTHGLPVIITNCSNNYGPRQFPEKLLPLVLLNALDGRPLPLYGDGKNVRDWLHVEDHARALWRALEAGRPGETYNVGGDSERTNVELVHELCAALDRLAPRAGGQPHAEAITFVRDRPGHDRRYAICHAKITRELGWQPTETLASGLENTASWYLENRAWCEAVLSSARYRRERLG